MHTDQATDPEHAELHDDEGMTPAASELSDAIYALVVCKASIEGLCPNCLLGLAWLHTTVRLILDHGNERDRDKGRGRRACGIAENFCSSACGRSLRNAARTHSTCLTDQTGGRTPQPAWRKATIAYSREAGDRVWRNPKFCRRYDALFLRVRI